MPRMYSKLQEEITSLRAELAAKDELIRELISVLRRHHDWHQVYSDEDAYCDSSLEQQTSQALARAKDAGY